MEALHGLSYPSFFPKVVHGNCSLKKWRNRCSVTALSGDDDLLFKASLRSATLRFQETNRPGNLSFFLFLSLFSEIAFRHLSEHLVGLYLMCLQFWIFSAVLSLLQVYGDGHL